MNHKLKILIIGYGNPGRQDDGLGVLLVDELHKWANEAQLDCIYTDSNYQLNLEDAATISDFQLVVFADASKEDIAHYAFVELEPSPHADFIMHAVSPSFILHICEQIFHRRPEVFLLHIKGYEWEFMARPTDKAISNLNMAIDFIKDYILKYSIAAKK